MPPAPQPHTSWQCAHQAQAMATTVFCHLHFLVISWCWNNTKWFPLCVLMCMIHVCIVYLYGMCMHALMCECGYPCVEFRGRLGCWPLASALRQVPFVTHSCVCQANWLESFQNDPVFTFHLKHGVGSIHTHSVYHMVLGTYTHPALWGCWDSYSDLHTWAASKCFTHWDIFPSPEWLPEV